LFVNLPSYEYYEQLSIRKGGYVEVINDSALIEDEKFVNVASKIASLLQQGVNSNDISILTYTNADVLSLYNYLKIKFPTLKISTEMTSKLINQENVKAVINAVKYLYFKEDIYKENLNALVGNEILTKMTIEFDSHKKSVQEIIKISATNLKIIDENVVKFIESCSIYNNIVDFVYEVDKLDAVMENSESSGLQILTIFKSKGLEFNTVLLLDRIKRKNVDKSSLLFEYDSVELKNIFYKIKGYENHNKQYKNAIEKEKALSLEDEINILYVALTRAKNNMIIFKKEKSSVFDILDMKVLSMGEIIQSTNISKNYDKVEKVIYTPMDLGSQEKQIAKEKDENEDEDANENMLHSKYFGIATHFCLEMMNAFTLEELDATINLCVTRFSNYLSSSDFDNIKKRVSLLISNELFTEHIKDAQFISEQALVFNGEIKIIDLLLYKDDKYYIFDYKTTQNKSPEHISQVAYYKKAIASIFDTKEVYSYLIYLKENEVLIDEV
jgi:exodeoxyribonuclease V beta subunit